MSWFHLYQTRTARHSSLGRYFMLSPISALTVCAHTTFEKLPCYLYYTYYVLLSSSTVRRTYLVYNDYTAITIIYGGIELRVRILQQLLFARRAFSWQELIYTVDGLFEYFHS